MAVSSWWDLFGGTLLTDLRYNNNEQEVTEVKDDTISPGRVFDLENQVPENSMVLNFDYSINNFGALVRVNYYDEWSTTDGVLGDPVNFTVRDYDEAVLVDIEARYTFMDHYTVAIGGENVFDEYPDDELGDVFNAWGVKYAVTSPFGFNGAFWYARISAAF